MYDFSSLQLPIQVFDGVSRQLQTPQLRIGAKRLGVYATQLVVAEVQQTKIGQPRKNFRSDLRHHVSCQRERIEARVSAEDIVLNLTDGVRFDEKTLKAEWEWHRKGLEAVVVEPELLKISHALEGSVFHFFKYQNNTRR